MFDLRYRCFLWSMHYFGRSFTGINFKKKKEEDIKKSRKILDDNEKRRNCLEKENEFIRHK